MNIERQIEFDKVKDIWSDLAITDWAKEQIREILKAIREKQAYRVGDYWFLWEFAAVDLTVAELYNGYIFV